MTEKKNNTPAIKERRVFALIADAASKEGAEGFKKRFRENNEIEKLASELSQKITSKEQVRIVVRLLLAHHVSDIEGRADVSEALSKALGYEAIWEVLGNSTTEKQADAVKCVRVTLALIERNGHPLEYAEELIEGLSEFHSGFGRLTVSQVYEELTKETTKGLQAPHKILRNLADKATTETSEIWPTATAKAFRSAFRKHHGE